MARMFEGNARLGETNAPCQESVSLPGVSYRIEKRLLDLLGAVFALILFSPFFIVVPVLIRLESPGPTLFKQKRSGYMGRPFQILKFRTMVPDAEARLREVLDVDQMKEPMFKLKHDPRVTRIGAFLRATSLDELPQFINVLRGDMSLVGPRPEEVWLVEKYDAVQRQRLLGKPGITGPMQIGGRGDLSLAERVALDVDYLQHPSIWRDLKIIFQTVPAVLLRKGAR